MNQNYRVFLLLLLPFALQFLVGCCDCESRNVFHTFIRNGINLQAYDNTSVSPDYEVSDGVDRNAFAMKLVLLRTQLSDVNREIPAVNFFNSCYAFTCDCPTNDIVSYGDQVTSFKLITMLDFDETHPAGSEIGEYFQWFNADYYNYDILIEEVSNSRVLDKEDLVFDVLLMNPPAQSQNAQFQVILTFEDGTEMISQTPVITLL